LPAIMEVCTTRVSFQRSTTGGAVAAVAVVSTVWTPEPPTRVRVAMRLKAPLELGLLGTDHFGRDVLSMLMAGAWNSLAIAFPAVLLGALVGVVIGSTAAALRGWFDEVAMRAADVVFAFPAVLSAIFLEDPEPAAPILRDLGESAPDDDPLPGLLDLDTPAGAPANEGELSLPTTE